MEARGMSTEEARDTIRAERDAALEAIRAERGKP
jgi:hypothetical protein